MKLNFNKYIIFWLSQSVSQLGSAMTSFALILWAYTQNGSTMTVSLMSENTVSSVLHVLVGQGAGSGMAVMFLCTGVLGSLFSLISYQKKELRELG